MKILVLLLIIWLISIILKPLLKVWRTMNQVKRGDFSGLNDFFGQPGAQKGSSAYEANGQRKAGWSKAAIRKKKIGKDVGEYVKFSEITISHEETTSTGNSTTTYITEQQVTDVEWEDIK